MSRLCSTSVVACSELCAKTVPKTGPRNNPKFSSAAGVQEKAGISQFRFAFSVCALTTCMLLTKRGGFQKGNYCYPTF